MKSSDVVLGIDIGGTYTKFGYVDREGGVKADGSISTDAQNPAKLLVERLASGAKELSAKLGNNFSLVGVGIGAPNANYHRGTIEYPPNLKWPGITYLVKLFQEYYDVPIAITNDANAAALGEGLFGAAKGMKDFIVITLGTGLGSGLVANGELIYGADGFAGELGHTIYDPNGRDCGCGRKGCLEQYASAPGICKTVFELLSKRRVESELRRIVPSELTSKHVFEATLRKDPIAVEAFEMTGEILGFKLADTVAHTSPEAIILFGGLANAGELIFAPTKRSLEAHLQNIFKGKVKILPSALKEGNAAILGAAALIWNELGKMQSATALMK